MATKIANGLDLLNQRIQNLGDGSSATDAVTLQQLQAYVRGLDWKVSVRAASTGNLTLSGAQTIDGVSVIAGDRVLVKDQTTGADNGIYVAAAGTWARAVDADSSAEVTSGMAVTVTEGTVNGDKAYILTTNDPIVLATDALVFTQLGGATPYSAGTNGGLTLSSNAFSILLDSGSGLSLGAGGIKIDPAYAALAKRYSTNVPNNTTAVITHNLGTLDVIVQVREISGGAVVMPDIVVVDTNTVNLVYAAAPGSATHRVTVLA
jgi:hypothetical protein